MCTLKDVHLCMAVLWGSPTQYVVVLWILYDLCTFCNLLISEDGMSNVSGSLDIPAEAENVPWLNVYSVAKVACYI